jgi:hypothetical protein
MSMRKILQFSLLLALLIITTNSSAGIYRWVDENGNVQFGDRPPPEVETSDEVEVRSQEPAANSKGSSPVNRKEARKRLLEQYQREREEKKEAAAKKRKEKQQRQARCSYAKSKLTEYLEHGRLYKRGANQERQYLSDQERNAAIAKARADVKKWCK